MTCFSISTREGKALYQFNVEKTDFLSCFDGLKGPKRNCFLNVKDILKKKSQLKMLKLYCILKKS
jgi:hypothetical protein